MCSAASQPELRPIAPADWEAIGGIQKECFPPTAQESLPALQSLAEVSPATCAVIARQSTVFGYVLAHPWRPDDLPPLGTVLTELPPAASALYIHDLAVRPAGQGQGFARRLVEHLITEAGRRRLTEASLLSVQGSQPFWSGYGFVNRPDLTARFAPQVWPYYQIGFDFMTARLGGAATSEGG